MPRTEASSARGESLKSPNGAVQDETEVSLPSTSTRKKSSKYRHVAAYHSEARPSSLSREADVLPNFLGFRNLMVLVLVAMNLRLIIENFMKYGVLICIKCHDYRRQDVVLGSILFASVPCHLLVAYIIELSAATAAKQAVGRQKKTEKEKEHDQKVFQSTWPYTAFLHTLNATLCLTVTSFVVYFYIHHPGIGTICELHAIIVWLKICSYAFTNRDLRLALLNPSADPGLPEIYSSCPYPRNITINNLAYFWLAPTLVYQPVYPRTASIRWSFVAKRLAEFVVLAVFIWLLSAQYAAPVLRNSIDKIAVMDIASILERVMKLSTISLIIWLAGFFALFQALLNALAEVMQFGDREFYTDWWNSSSLGGYWRSWNRPVYLFMKRHVYSPLVGRGWSPLAASGMVFTLSAILHEMLVGIPTHNFIGVAFFGMMFQLPLISLTAPLEKMRGPEGRVIGNCIFWVSFCLVGQPLGALLYFFAWQAKYGSVNSFIMVAFIVPSNYGAVIGVALGAIPVLGFVHGAITGNTRKAAKVPYPHSYASMELCKENAKAEKFNCAQRAHTNFLENAPQTMLFTLVAGLKYPEWAAGLGALWVFFRALFLYGYVYSNKPQGKGRMIGGFFWFVQGALWGLSVFGVGKELL
ncbi:Membrane-associated eicosanoid/glutathione metabolism (MAPEG) protein [Penicillium cf. griseofulvum]|uniref:diacylglycerol O-acyltransferase n=1 Tax=Penicillium cf. griseofulvum TaxID=2972120 RepID=A0A9W9MTU5_9EURO|nr:Membrane-associated eicosanoid/glutathione metabolism (MAPEG) protein [Penicillium cf. griseofulvum]KAJ5446010.1 Membrane-associated eicosanoid/glutathione metabolism (MAPEG) protein [Penicillium cf. griseofulvum]KAJ5447752.1 Membrane-associated eicosanoid/glutathione metabolism (MAPEG) protein [Penicillium cf. griseofulvum]